MAINVRKRLRNLLLIILMTGMYILDQGTFYAIYNANKIFLLAFVAGFIILCGVILDYFLYLPMNVKFSNKKVEYMPKNNRNKLLRFVNMLLAFILLMIFYSVFITNYHEGLL